METCHCSHCGRDIPHQNFDIHVAHCERNLIRCETCKDMIPKDNEDIHHNEFHAQVSCSHCGQSLEKVQVSDHERRECPMRQVVCQYCDLDQVAAELAGHQDVCGNRTEWCGLCQKYIRLNTLKEHEKMHTRSDSNGEDNDRQTQSVPSQETSQGNGDGEASESELSNRDRSNACDGDSDSDSDSDRSFILIATAGAAALIVAVALGVLRARRGRAFI